MKFLRSLFIILILGICFFGCVNLSLDSENKNSKKTPDSVQSSTAVPIAVSEELATAFDKQIANAGLFSQTVDLSDIKPMQEQIWTIWKATNTTELKKIPELKQIKRHNANNVQTTLAAAPRWTVPGLMGGKDYEMPYEYVWWKNGAIPSKSNPYPFCIYLHGSGYNRNSEWQLANVACDAANRKSVFFNPRGPDGSNYNKWWNSSFQIVWEDLLRLVLLQDYIDPKQIYIAGYSEGGYGTQRLASFYGDYFTGAAPMGGGEPLENAPPINLMYTRCCMLIGNGDSTYGRYTLTKKLDSVLKELQKGDSSKYKNVFLEQDADHQRASWSASKGVQEIVNPSENTRVTNPTEVHWEDFPMAGRRRVGFYNIHVLERPNNSTDARIEYRMKIENGNKINLTVRDVEYRGKTFVPGYPSLAIDYDKTYTEVTSGRVRIYLYPDMNGLDLNQPITVTVNEEITRNIQPTVSVQSMVDSVKAFFDPQRIYPAYIEVDLNANN